MFDWRERAAAFQHRHLARWFPPGTPSGELLRALARAVRLTRGGGPRAALAELIAGMRPARWLVGSANEGAWLAAHDPDPRELAAQRRWTPAQRPAPVFSLLVPLYRTHHIWLVELVESVRAQTYRGWELCLAVADDEDPALVRRVHELAALDPRIRPVRLAANRGISAATNAALAEATGNYVAFVDHDDRLAPDALYEVGRLLDRYPETDVVYTDEDYLAADGQRRYRPRLKPAWSPELLAGYNYAGHLLVVRRRLVTELGGLRSECDGAQDWDLVLRLAEHTDRVRHVPRVLYHWRAVPGSSALEPAAKPWALAAQRRALGDHFARRGLTPRVETQPSGVQRVTWTLTHSPLVSLIVPTRDQRRHIRRLVTDLSERTAYAPCEIILVDTGSTDPAVPALYHEWQERLPLRVIDCPGPFNFSRACNQGAATARGEILGFLNNDLEVGDPQWLAELVRWAQLPEIGVVGAQLDYPGGGIQHAGVAIGGGALGWHLFRHRRAESWTPLGPSHTYRNVSALTGACQVLRRDVFSELGGFDEAFELCYSDFALALAAGRAGYRNMVTPYARLVHHECATRRPLDEREGRDAVRFAALLTAWDAWEDPYFPQALSAEPVPRLRGEDTPCPAAEARQAAARLLATADQSLTRVRSRRRAA